MIHAYTCIQLNLLFPFDNLRREEKVLFHHRFTHVLSSYLSSREWSHLSPREQSLKADYTLVLIGVLEAGREFPLSTALVFKELKGAGIIPHSRFNSAEINWWRITRRKRHLSLFNVHLGTGATQKIKFKERTHGWGLNTFFRDEREMGAEDNFRGVENDILALWTSGRADTGLGQTLPGVDGWCPIFRLLCSVHAYWLMRFQNSCISFG